MRNRHDVAFSHSSFSYSFSLSRENEERLRERERFLSMKRKRTGQPSRAATEFRYEKLTWPEINDAIDLGKVCVIPCGAVEQHGAHLPLDVDIVCPTGIARGVGALI